MSNNNNLRAQNVNQNMKNIPLKLSYMRKFWAKRQHHVCYVTGMRTTIPL